VVASSAKAGDGLVVVCADGHGDRQHFRSHVGSRLACATGQRVGLELLHRLAEDPKRELKECGAQVASQRICKEWLRGVRTHISHSPFSCEERELVPAKNLSAFEQCPEGAYGTTLLLVIAWKAGLLALQLGDGDIVLVTDSERRHLIPRVERGGCKTDSLCDPAASEKFRVHLDHFEYGVPPYVFVSTDGWANAFENEFEELRTNLDIVKWLQTSGSAQVEAALHGVLEDVSEQGWSEGDDASLAILFDEFSPKED
jgi:hypothetical protein